MDASPALLQFAITLHDQPTLAGWEECLKALSMSREYPSELYLAALGHTAGRILIAYPWRLDALDLAMRAATYTNDTKLLAHWLRQYDAALVYGRERALHRLALGLEQINDHAGAISRWGLATLLDEDDPIPLGQATRLALASGDSLMIGRMDALFTQKADLFPDSSPFAPWFHRMHAQLGLAMGNLYECLKRFHKAECIHPEPETLNGMSEAFVACGNTEHALESWHESLTLAPLQPWILFRAYQVAGNDTPRSIEQALEWCMKTWNLDLSPHLSPFIQLAAQAEQMTSPETMSGTTTDNADTDNFSRNTTKPGGLLQ